MTPFTASFTAHLPVRISFGDGVIHELPGVFQSLEARSALVVVEEPVAEHLDVVGALVTGEAAGVRLERFVKGPGEPTFALADELAERVRASSHDAVVGIGGGSALDVAKAARLVADQGGAAADYAAGRRVPAPPRIGLVLCPTTAGTGSEVSGASVLTDTERDRKVGFGHPNMRAQHALVDPVLTHGLPAGPTAHSGVDALAQAIGGCTVRNSSPLSLAFGLEACRHVAQSLARAVADGTDADARRQLACASLTAGLAMNLSDCAADHALGQALGSVAHLPHGLTIGLVVAETLELSRGDCADAARACGGRARRARGRVGRRLTCRPRRPAAPRRGRLPDAARGRGRRADPSPKLVERTFGEQSYNLEIDCHAWTTTEVEQAFRAALALEAR